MAFRSRTRVRRGPRKRAIWVNIPFGNVVFTESVGRQLLLVPEDWEASFTGLANESAVLRAIVGQIVFSQTTAGTLGGNLFWGIYLAGIDKAPPVFTTTGMSDVSWLRCGARATASSVTSSITTTTFMGTEDVHIVSKRKLTTNSQIAIVAQYGADVASPAGSIGGILRFLIARD